MTNYNYKEAVKKYIIDYIDNNINFGDYEDLYELECFLNDTLCCDGIVPANGLEACTLLAECIDEILDEIDVMPMHFSFTNGHNPYLYYGTPAGCKRELERLGRLWDIVHLHDDYYELKEKHIIISLFNKLKALV